jgi:zinc transport system ATP-binding protein
MIIDINNLTFAYGHKTVISNLSVTIRPGDFLVVSGKNGSGKSTLVKCLLGINPVSNGMIFFDHGDINYFKRWTEIGYVPQKFDDFNYEFPITVSEILSVSKLRRTHESQKLKLLDDMGILEIMNDSINSLSGGQIQRVFIVRAMLNAPRLLILDEPTASIDRKNVEYFRQTVNKLHASGVTIILISHEQALDDLDYTHELHLDTNLTYTVAVRPAPPPTEDIA